MTNLILDVSGSVDINIFKMFLRNAKGLDSELNVIQGSFDIEKIDKKVKSSEIINIQKANNRGGLFDLPKILITLKNREELLIYKTYVFTDDSGLIQRTQEFNFLNFPIIIVDFFYRPAKPKSKNIQIISSRDLPNHLRKEKLKKLQGLCEL